MSHERKKMKTPKIKMKEHLTLNTLNTLSPLQTKKKTKKNENKGGKSGNLKWVIFHN